MTAILTPGGHCLGWRPDLVDTRDWLYRPEVAVTALPPHVDLMPGFGPVLDQGQLGSCTANGIAGAIDFADRKEGWASENPSRLFIYWNERNAEGTVNSDAGAAIRDGVKVIAKLGAPPETDWPYDIAKFRERPPAAAFAAAKRDRLTRYWRVQSHPTLGLACLAAGFPFVGGIVVYPSFEAATDGVIPMPEPGEAPIGGHCILFGGYDLALRRYKFRNSWAASWGQDGDGTMPFEYLAQLGSDLWTIRRMTAA